MEKSTYEEYMKQAEYRKTWSIAFFNATNAAIELVKGFEISDENKMIEISKWRTWLLGEHARYYAENIATVGGLAAVDPKVIEGLDRAKANYENKSRPSG